MNKNKGLFFSGAGVGFKALIEGLAAKPLSYDLLDSKVTNSIMLALVGIGFWITMKSCEKDERVRTAVKFVLISAAIYLGLRLIVLVVVIGVPLMIFLFMGGWRPSINLSDDSPPVPKPDSEEQDTREIRRQRRQDLHKTTGIPREDIYINSDGTRYHTGDGNWKKFSSDGSAYEDDSGGWHNFE